MMKLQHLLLAAVAACTFSACSLNGSAESTPLLRVGAINESRQDTLDFMGNRLDTVYVGDTIKFFTQSLCRYNRLLELNIVSSDTSHVEFLWGREGLLDSLFTAHGDGHFELDGRTNYLSFPFQYIIKQPKDGLTLTFSVLTDASSEYNTNSVTVITPAKEAAEK